MKNKPLIILFVLFLVTAAFFLFTKLQRSDLTEEIETRLSKFEEGQSVQIEGKRFQTSDELKSFYKNREFEEVWSKNGKINSTANDFLEELENVKYDGLNPEDYNLALIQEFFEDIKSQQKILKPKSTPELVDLDFLMTDAFFRLAKDLELGKIGPESRGTYWKLEAKESNTDPLELLNSVAEGEDIEDALASLYPKLDMYSKGREVLKTLYETSERDTLNWKQVSFEQSLKVGDRNQSVPKLRERLQFWGFLDTYETEDELLFDSTMWEGLKKYQIENGMKPDGAIGDLTAGFLNDSPEKLIDIASVNMERMRWLPEINWDEELVLVNIANYQLDYLDKGDTTLSAKVIVGKEYNESPVFSAPMSYIVFSPYWNIPSSITQDEILPSLKKNKAYLQEKNMEVVSNTGEVLDPNKVNWKEKDGEEFPFRIRQKPGGSNSLGLVKFMFPNDYNIYIHDTPARSLFQRESRALSHGCIRIQYPDQFAKSLLRDKKWTTEKISEAMHQENEEVVKLNREVPVLLLYLTFWTDDKGQGHFRPDIYNRDAELLKALRSAPKAESIERS
ncbi:L,D-transpeptidase family protein [Algoriphagus machipongonensis]|uniref:Peptidoglycan binding domain-containing protein n=1 Tax=Algoriphagus machipongonensis TaxID=388413 RepID=A3I141_9BACT|nr:L,D-transpeptidase family protein [Algoriphagus machipongonensis]EAZ80187.1 peptidoglycan binding domain-containing protein [Algoriphagus machipongonensis]